MARKTTNVDDFIIDFKDEVQGAGAGIRVKAGTYLVRITAAKGTVSEEKGTPGLEMTLTFKDGRYKGKKLTERVWATPKAYSRFRVLLEACGKKSPARINLGRIAVAVKGCDLYVEVGDEKRPGYSTRSRVTFNGFIHPDDYDPDADEADDDIEDDDVEDDDETDDDTDDDDTADDDEDEEPAPRARRRTAPAAKPAARSRRKAKVEPADEDEDLDDLDLDEL